MTTLADIPRDAERAPPFAADAPLAARSVLALLTRLGRGTLELRAPDGRTARFGSTGAHAGGTAAEPQARIELADWSVCARALKAGDIGFAEAFIDGGWTTPDLVALLKLLAANRDDIERVVYGTWWGGLLHRLRHLFRRNTRRRSAKNIRAHYDLGNDFYRLWLDPSMHYSSAWFEGRRDGDLVAAQQAKTRRALRQCRVEPGQRVLEIGCGWGALAEIAAREFEARVTGITLSAEQLAWAEDRLAAAGLDAELRLQDYRAVADAPFDAVVSIEMFEAVGRAWWPAFFRTLRERLKPGGRVCIQTITIRDDLFDRYVRSTDFIQQYVFPGGLLPSRREFLAQAAAAGLVLDDELAFGADYAETLSRWRERFLAEQAKVAGLGFDGRFQRTWEFYLAYCEAAFATGNTDVRQFTFVNAASPSS